MKNTRPLTLSLALCMICLFTTSSCSAAERQPDSQNTELASNTLQTSGFPDVSADAWYAEAVQFCSERGLIDAASPGAFSPDAPASRATLVTALYRQSGSPAAQQPHSFSDVPEAYSDAVAWAAENGIITGYGDGRFGGDDSVTREQFAAMLWRAEGKPSPTTSVAFADQGKISAYAADAVTWAKGAGIVNGKGDNKFDPKASITRGEVAVMLFRWLNASNQSVSSESEPYDGIYLQHEPYGTGIGVMPGRVVWAHNPESVSWNGSGYWWELNHFDEAAIQVMVNDSIASLGGKSTAKEGWAALFRATQERQGKNGGYAVGQKIAIKANINGSAVMDDDTSGKTSMSYTNPVLLKALLTSLVEEAGVRPADITVYDVSRLFPDYMVELCVRP